MEVLVLVPASHYLCTTWDHNQLDPKLHILEAIVCDRPSHLHQEVLKVVSSFCHSLYCKHILCKRISGKNSPQKYSKHQYMNVYTFKNKIIVYDQIYWQNHYDYIDDHRMFAIIGCQNWKFILKCSITSGSQEKCRTHPNMIFFNETNWIKQITSG